MVQKRTATKVKNVDKLDKDTITYGVCEAISGNHAMIGKEWGAFPHKYHVVEPDAGVRRVMVESTGQVLSYVHENAVTISILEYIDTIPHAYADYRRAREIALTWIHKAKLLNGEIASVRQKSEAGYTYTRLPFDAEVDFIAEAPLWNEFLKRCTNSKALCCFIGSLFVDKSDRQQYLYLHGDGQNGKGALIRLLRRMLGQTFSSEVVPDSKDKFWTSGLIGKRLVVFPDCNNPTFPQGGLFKSLSGGDPVRVERKNRDSYTADLICKFLFLSNESLIISSQKADQRRAIYCEVTPIEAKPDPMYEEKLWTEARYILGTCIAAYKAHCPNYGSIETDEKADTGLSDLVDSKYETFIGVHCEVTESDDDKVLCQCLNERLAQFFSRNPREQGQFLSYIRRRYHVTKKQENDGKRFYQKLRMKPVPVDNRVVYLPPRGK